MKIRKVFCCCFVGGFFSSAVSFFFVAGLQVAQHLSVKWGHSLLPCLPFRFLVTSAGMAFTLCRHSTSCPGLCQRMKSRLKSQILHHNHPRLSRLGEEVAFAGNCLSSLLFTSSTIGVLASASSCGGNRKLHTFSDCQAGWKIS